MIRSFDSKNSRIAASAFVSEAAYVIGDVEVGENSTIWPGSTRGKDSRLSSHAASTRIGYVKGRTVSARKSTCTKMA